MSSADVSVSVVTVTYNSAAFVGRFLRALFRANLDAIELEVIVVDNGSTDETVAIIVDDYPQVQVIRNPVNNYAGALNRGTAAACGDFIVVANNDGTPDQQWLQALLSVMHGNPAVGAVQSKILFAESGLLNSAGVEEVEHFYFRDIGFQQLDSLQYERVAARQFLSGGAVMFRRACLAQVGDWDEDFSLYLEDVDYSIRCRKAGWKLMFAPLSVFRHAYHGVATDDLCDYFCSRNRLLLIAKHFPEALSSCVTSSHFYSTEEYDLLYAALLEALVILCYSQDETVAAAVLQQVSQVVLTQFGKACHDELFSQLQLRLQLRPLRVMIAGHYKDTDVSEQLCAAVRERFAGAVVSQTTDDFGDRDWDVWIQLSGAAHPDVRSLHTLEAQGPDTDWLALIDAAVLDLIGVDVLPQTAGEPR